MRRVASAGRCPTHDARSGALLLRNAAMSARSTGSAALAREVVQPAVPGVDVADVAVLQDLQRVGELAGEAEPGDIVADGVEVARRVEVRHALAIDGVPDGLTRIADLEQVVDADAGFDGMRRGDQAVPVRIRSISSTSWLTTVVHASSDARTSAKGWRLNALVWMPVHSSESKVRTSATARS